MADYNFLKDTADIQIYRALQLDINIFIGNA